MRRRTPALAVAVLAAGAALAQGGSAVAGRDSVTAAQLALMPLGKAALGSAAGGLSLAQDSGALTDVEAASDANGNVTGAALSRLGRITGYQLDYGGSPLGGSAVFEVQTGVELYGSAAEAVKGFAFWRKDETDVASLTAAGFVVVQKLSGVAGLGDAAFLDTGSVTVKGKASLTVVDVDFRTGPLVASVEIGGGSLASARRTGLALAHDLEARIRGVLAGKIGGPPVALPGKVKAGPPPAGPSLEAMALTPADFGGATTVTSQGYVVDTDLNPVSEYRRKLSPAGPFAIVVEQVALFRTAGEASYDLAIIAQTVSSKSAGPAGNFTVYKPRTVTAAGGDEARAVLVTTRQANGNAVYLGFVFVRVGKTLEVLTVGLPSTDVHAASELTGLAGSAATRARGGSSAGSHGSGGTPVA